MGFYLANFLYLAIRCKVGLSHTFLVYLKPSLSLHFLSSVANLEPDCQELCFECHQVFQILVPLPCCLSRFYLWILWMFSELSNLSLLVCYSAQPQTRSLLCSCVNVVFYQENQCALMIDLISK